VFDDIGWSLVSEDEMDSEVLVIGAGPTGLVLALWLTKLGVKVRIVDKTAEAGTTSRALAIQARTLELYRQLDLAEAIVAPATRFPPSICGLRVSPRRACPSRLSART
jgi:threonine dehydrogenase-like Zn-dependent dehydrogenase